MLEPVHSTSGFRGNGRGGSTVSVRYELTALSEAGNETLKGFDAKTYAAMLEQWKQQIRDADLGDLGGNPSAGST